MIDKIFLVHGMGHHPATWHSDAEAKLRELYARYPRQSRGSFDDRFDLGKLLVDERRLRQNLTDKVGDRAGRN